MFEKTVYFWKHELPFYRARLCKKYYIIRRTELGAGFFSNYWWVMGHIVFARKLGYLPVVDMQNYKTLYSEEEPVCGETNAWNYYFENVGGVRLQDAYDSGKYVLAEARPLHKYADKYCEPTYRYPTGRTIDYYYPLQKRYMRIRPEIVEKFEKKWEDFVRGRDKILGVHVRGTDMRNDLGHPVPAAVEAYIDQAGKILGRDSRIDAIFLSTDETDVTEAFQKAFAKRGIRVFWNEAFRVGSDPGAVKKTGVHETKPVNPRERHKYLLGMEVLCDAWCLAKCNYLLCGYSNITNVVLIWNHHQYEEVVRLGKEGTI